MGSTSASMTDLVFLLLIFFMIASTLINNNALQLTLPKSTSPTQDKPATIITIRPDLSYYLDEQPIDPGQLEGLLQSKLQGEDKPMVYLYADKSVPWDNVVKVMNIARNNDYKLNAGTAPE